MTRFFVTVCFVAMTAMLTACPHRCQTGTMRCLNSTAQLCRPDKTWADVVNCSKLDAMAPWSCACSDPKKCGCKKP